MHSELLYDISPARSQSEHAVDMWERLCGRWDAAFQRAQKTGDWSKAARAELNLKICERERHRVVSLFRMQAA